MCHKRNACDLTGLHMPLPGSSTAQSLRFASISGYSALLSNFSRLLPLLPRRIFSPSIYASLTWRSLKVSYTFGTIFVHFMVVLYHHKLVLPVKPLPCNSSTWIPWEHVAPSFWLNDIWHIKNHTYERPHSTCVCYAHAHNTSGGNPLTLSTQNLLYHKCLYVSSHSLYVWSECEQNTQQGAKDIPKINVLPANLSKYAISYTRTSYKHTPTCHYSIGHDLLNWLLSIHPDSYVHYLLIGYHC